MAQLAENLLPMSPLQSERQENGPDNSVSFSGTKLLPGTATCGSTMSTDSCDGPLSGRAAFGELQHDNFEFHKPTLKFGNAKAPFSSLYPEASTDSARTPDQRSREPMTPTSVVPGSGVAFTAAAANRVPIAWADIMLWKEPLQTLAIFALGLVGFWFLTFIFYGAHSMSLVSGVAYLLLLDVGINFLRYFVSKSWHDNCLWGGAAQMKHVLTRLNGVVLHLAAAHDKYLSAVDPVITLKIAGALWAVAWVGTFLSFWWCALLAYIGAFTVPITYQATRNNIEAITKSFRAATIDKVDAAGLPRTARFVVVACAVAALYFFSSWAQFAIGFFVAATYWRTLLMPREIDMIRTVAEPYTQSVHKVSRHISVVAEDTFARLSTAGPSTRTKSHFRAE